MEPRPDGRGKVAPETCGAFSHYGAAMEPRPDGRGKVATGIATAAQWLWPQWSPGLMAGGSPSTTGTVTPDAPPQWSPGLMAGGSSPEPSSRHAEQEPQWSPGLMAGGRPLAHHC